MPTVSTQTTVNLTSGQRLVISGNGTVDFVTGFKGFDGSSVFIKSQKEFGPVESLGGYVILKPVTNLVYTLEQTNKPVEYDPDSGSIVSLPDLSPVSGVRIFADAGGVAAPISSFDGASVSGKFGLATPILIPANTLVAGQSRIRISVTQRKVGAANNYLQVHFGPTNGVGDTAVIATQISTAGTTPVPSTLTADLSIASDGTYTTYLHSRTNVGVTTGESSVTSGVNTAVDNYINFVVSGSAAGTVNSLLGYTVEVFP